jgi:hypothetical protein
MIVKKRSVLDGLKAVFKALTRQRKSYEYVPGRQIIPGPDPVAPPFGGSPKMDEALIKKLSATGKPYANVPFNKD